MTGDELKRIYKMSGLKADDFAARLKMERHQLYTQFGRQSKPIDLEIETALKNDPALAKEQFLSEVQQNLPAGPGPTVELLAKSLDMINETLVMIKNSLNIIADDNRFIKEDAEIYRSIVKSGIDQGAIKFAGFKK
jgi:UTP:GlnB (protein PII) uridylyltransferase